MGGDILTRASQKDEGAQNFLQQRGTRGKASGPLARDGGRHRQEECLNPNCKKP